MMTMTKERLADLEADADRCMAVASEAARLVTAAKIELCPFKVGMLIRVKTSRGYHIAMISWIDFQRPWSRLEKPYLRASKQLKDKSLFHPHSTQIFPEDYEMIQEAP